MRAVALALLMPLLAVSGTKHYFGRPVFVYAAHPDLPMERYAAGNLGIPEPGHARLYLYAAYRYLDGRPLTAGEQRALINVWRVRVSRDYDAPDTRGYQIWRVARGNFPNASIPRRDETERRGYTFSYVCSDDAFATAAATLEARARQFGRQSREVGVWLEGQDAVFASCSAMTARLPSAAPADVAPLIKADREYQIAAALFYTSRFDEALDQFAVVAKNASSPWRVWAPYLIGRTWLWKARTTQDEKLYSTSLRRAEAQFERVLANPSLRITHDAAENLLIRCMLVTRPKQGIERLGRRIIRADTASTRETDLFLYVSAMENAYDPDPYTERKAFPPWPQDDLSQWLLLIKNGERWAYGGCLARWLRTGSKAWLYAAMVQAEPDSPRSAELVRAALQSPIDAPGGIALHYQAARLLGGRGQWVEARRAADAVVGRLAAYRSARNRALQLRMTLTASIEGFLQGIPRNSILASSEMDRWEMKANDYGTDTDGRIVAACSKLGCLDTPTAHLFNKLVPLDTMHAMTRTIDGLPPHLLRELRLVTWTRGVMLGRLDVARDLTSGLIAAYPKAALALRRFAAATDAGTANAEAAFAMLELPGARPYMSANYGRAMPADVLDSWSRNWWYELEPSEMYTVDIPYWGSYGSDRPSDALDSWGPPNLAFLSAEQQRQGRLEWNQLKTHGEQGLNWIAMRIAEAIAKNPKRARAADTLYRVLQASAGNQWAYWPVVKGSGLRAAKKLLETQYRGTEAQQALANDYRFSLL